MTAQTTRPYGSKGKCLAKVRRKLFKSEEKFDVYTDLVKKRLRLLSYPPRVILPTTPPWKGRKTNLAPTASTKQPTALMVQERTKGRALPPVEETGGHQQK
jgi:hypothetical protein